MAAACPSLSVVREQDEKDREEAGARDDAKRDNGGAHLWRTFVERATRANRPVAAAVKTGRISAHGGN